MIYKILYVYITFYKMSTQIFKKDIPNEILLNLLDNICVKNDKHYILNNESFKKGLFNDFIQQFIV